MDPEQPTSDQSDVAVLDRAPEIPQLTKQLPLAEEIAEFRTELESKIIGEAAPVPQWSGIFKQTFESHPNLAKYQELFTQILRETTYARAQLDTVWKDDSATEKGVFEDPLQTKNEVAGPKTSRNLFHTIFKFYPEGEVQAIKDTITLRFVVDDNDYKKIQGIDSKEEIINGAITYFVPGFFFPVVVLRQNRPFTNLVHEVEHGKNKLLKQGRHDFILFSRQGGFELSKKLSHREARNSPFQEPIKDELLAYFSHFTTFEIDTDIPETQVQEAVDKYLNGIQGILLDSERNYYPKYTKDLTQEQIDQYISSTQKGAAAIGELFMLYYKLDKNIAAARMAMNVLEQFPLHYWPAVVRLLKSRHKQDLVKKDLPPA